jgi:hypothetical protein
MIRYLGKSDIFYEKVRLRGGRKIPRQTEIPDNSQPWVEEIKSLKDLLYIADQVARLAEIYGPDGILQKNQGLKLSEVATIYDQKNLESANSAAKIAEEYGFDVSLIDVNLKKKPEQRIADMNKQLSGILELRETIGVK